MVTRRSPHSPSIVPALPDSGEMGPDAVSRRARAEAFLEQDAFVIQRLGRGKQRRLDELAERATLGQLTPEEQREREDLVAEVEALMVENAKALVRHRYPERYAAAAAVERQIRRRLRRPGAAEAPPQQDTAGS